MTDSFKKVPMQQYHEEHCTLAVETCPVNASHGLYNGVPFCSLIQDHFSWGASVETCKSVNFKLFTFNDVEEAWVEIKRVGKEIITIPLEICDCGVFEKRVPPEMASDGDRYRFVIKRQGKNPVRVRDPYSMKQDGFSKWSTIYDHNKYKWNDKLWMAGKNIARVSRRATKDNGLSCIGSLKIYEVNLATLTKDGTYKAAKKAFEKIAKEKHFNAVEIMPVENTYGYNWGYDGVDKFAPSHILGEPDDLKHLIDYAHKLNLNVIMDIVPNHLGPDLADLQNSGPYTDGTNVFGYKFNFEKPNSKYVREYIINTALNWLVNYHCDGLRVDMTKFMHSDYTMKQMAAEVHHHTPDSFLIAEDGRDNDPRVTAPFTHNEKYQNDHEHCAFLCKIATCQIPLLNLGFDSEWDFPFHKQIAASVLGCWDGHLKNMINLDYAVKHSGMRVKYPMSHDEIGNLDGTRLVTKIFCKEMELEENVVGKTKLEKVQIAAHAAHNILVALLTGKLDGIHSLSLEELLEENHLTKSYTFEEIKQGYKYALAMHRLAIGKTYSVPGPKMIFQGDEEANLSYFKFFRKFSTGYEKCLENKGYCSGDAAFCSSKLDSIDYSFRYKKYLQRTEQYTKDLNDIVAYNPALQSGVVDYTVVHPISSVHALHCKKDANEIFSVSNFSKESYFKNYYLEFPKGKWLEISNTDNFRYGGKGKFLNRKIEVNGEKGLMISIPPCGMIFFKRIG